jgi:hypothetical protein
MLLDVLVATFEAPNKREAIQSRAIKSQNTIDFRVRGVATVTGIGHPFPSK